MIPRQRREGKAGSFRRPNPAQLFDFSSRIYVTLDFCTKESCFHGVHRFVCRRRAEDAEKLSRLQRTSELFSKFASQRSQ